jgi:hypothetical protein
VDVRIYRNRRSGDRYRDKRISLSEKVTPFKKEDGRQIGDRH